MVSDLKTFSSEGCKIAASKKKGEFCLNEQDVLASVFITPFNGLFVKCNNSLVIWNYWGKVVERSGLRLENF